MRLPGLGMLGAGLFRSFHRTAHHYSSCPGPPGPGEGASLSGVSGPRAGAAITQRRVLSPACPPPWPGGAAIRVTPSVCSVKTPHSKLLQRAAGGWEQLGCVVRFWQRPGMSSRWILCPRAAGGPWLDLKLNLAEGSRAGFGPVSAPTAAEAKAAPRPFLGRQAG